MFFWFFFFFSSRRRHTRSYGDWSSDVCSSDLDELRREGRSRGGAVDIQLVKRGHDAQREQRGRPEDAGVGLDAPEAGGHRGQIGRASCRERVSISGVVGGVQKKRRAMTENDKN